MRLTAIFIIVAVLLASSAWFTRPRPVQLTQLTELGEPFYPAFTDPLEAASLEVIDVDPETGRSTIFKVEEKAGVWTIPSHHGYPADGEDQLARTAGSLIGLRKDVFQSDRVADHEVFGVIDPLDASAASVDGRGARITLRDQAGGVLADYIIGHPVTDRTGYRSVRVPDEKRTYACRVDIELTTRFTDWIDTDVFEIAASDMKVIEIRDYAVDETTARVESAGTIALERTPEGAWTVADATRVPDGMQLDQSRIDRLTTALARMTITGVRPKPEGLTASLERASSMNLDAGTALSLQSRGFFFAPNGDLLSNEGEISVGATNGVRYVIRFGEIVFGDDAAMTRGLEDDPATETSTSDGAANRYILVTATFDESLTPNRPVPIEVPRDISDEERETLQRQNELAYQEWRNGMQQGRALAERLNRRFAPWYYVISAADDESLQIGVDELFVPADSDDDAVDETPDDPSP